jgi:hypothetical protein
MDAALETLRAAPRAGVFAIQHDTARLFAVDHQVFRLPGRLGAVHVARHADQVATPGSKHTRVMREKYFWRYHGSSSTAYNKWHDGKKVKKGEKVQTCPPGPCPVLDSYFALCLTISSTLLHALMTTRQQPLTSFLAIRPCWLVAALHFSDVPAVKDLVYIDVAAATLFAALELARVPTRQVSRTLRRNKRSLSTSSFGGIKRR